MEKKTNRNFVSTFFSCALNRWKLYFFFDFELSHRMNSFFYSPFCILSCLVCVILKFVAFRCLENRNFLMRHVRIRPFIVGLFLCVVPSTRPCHPRYNNNGRLLVCLRNVKDICGRSMVGFLFAVDKFDILQV